ncbi:MAG TPA: TAXI family TRAP transporter solute-binding subunit [Paracoccus sp.]|nr:TAXI family TRAP transporter solute-binding subunit [Paracoccus sp. (in: a-proteobacteria)]
MPATSTRRLGAAFAVAAALVAAPLKAQDLTLTLAGASPGGLWTLLGAGLDSAAKQIAPGSTITYQTTGGGFANAAIVSEGRAEIGLIHDAELAIAVAGGEPFRGPIENLRTIAYLYDWAPMQFIASRNFAERHGITSLADFARTEAPVRITINRAGNITGQVASAMLEAAGADDAAIRSWGGTVITAGSSEQSGLLMNGRVDIFTNGVFVGHSSIREIENAIDMTVLDIPENVRQVVAERFGIGMFTIPAGSYENQDSPVETVALGAVLIASDAMDDETAYTLTRALIENTGTIQGVHPAMAGFNHDLMTRQTMAPLHDGALRAYREAGLVQ